MSESPAASDRASDRVELGRVIRFRLRDRAYAIPMDAISGLAEVRPFRTVSGAPRAVLGVAEWRGRLLTVVDLAALLDDAPASVDSPGCLVRLAEPLGSTALLVPASVHLERRGGALRASTTGRARAIVGMLDLADEVHAVLDPRRIVAGLETRDVRGDGA